MPRSSILAAAFGAFIGTASVLVACARPVGAQAVGVTQYFRACTGVQQTLLSDPRGGASARDAALLNGFAAENAANPDLERQARSMLDLAATPHVIAHHVERTLGVATRGGDIVLLTDAARTATRWWTMRIDPSGHVADTRDADAEMVRRALLFPREFAAYALFNDLMGGDDTIPREACSELSKLWYGDFPGVLPGIDRALSAEASDDPGLDRRVVADWNALPQTVERDEESARIDRDTFARIGHDPEVRIIYRDKGLPGDGIGAIDVVRIGSAPVHTYSIVFEESKEPLGLGDLPACIVADTRCAKYYVWP